MTWILIFVMLVPGSTIRLEMPVSSEAACKQAIVDVKEKIEKNYYSSEYKIIKMDCVKK